VLKTRCVAGVDTVILRDTEHGSFAVAREWTDLATPNSCERVDGSSHRFELHLLCDLVTLVEALAARSFGGLAK
jgi:hypothetical protein